MNSASSQAGPIRIGFLGSGSVAIPALAALSASPLVDLLYVGTQPDRPAGRKRRLHPTPVGAWCDEREMDCERVETTRTEAFLDRLQQLALDFLVVFAFGQILRRPLLELPKCACINVHASLLPNYRGASPIQAALLAGDTETGISIMKMDVGLDTGPVYKQFPIPLDGTETASSLEANMAELAGTTIVPTLSEILSSGLKPTPQDNAVASHVSRIEKSDGHVDWNGEAASIERMVRAYSPWPGAWFNLKNGKRSQRIEVTAATVHPGSAETAPGTIVQADKHGWHVATACDTLEILRCKPEGKRDMLAVDFIRGARLEKGSNLTQDETPTH